MYFIKIFDLVVQKVMPALNKLHSLEFYCTFITCNYIQFYRGKYYGLVRIWIWKFCLCTQMELLRKAHGHSMLLACGFHMKIKIMIRFKEIIIQREKQVFSGNTSMEQELSVS